MLHVAFEPLQITARIDMLIELPSLSEPRHNYSARL
jgi:hypothetical protein